MSELADIAWAGGDFVLTAGGHPALVYGADVVRQDLLARLHCPPGAHWAYPDQGVDLSAYIQGTADPLTLLALRQDVEIGCEQDRRIVRADAVLAVLSLREVRAEVTATLTTGAALLLSTTFGGPRG
ncbi:hypothetical protein [uncultured Deinococcus sp.]|uniref:hypothetical protein n=1 Tax=uncultured Deinococcus sp. TaxID=158789 RepID=UPI0025859D60|nr:hypothetical protein [uncultured Deinococcus sp.]